MKDTCNLNPFILLKRFECLFGGFVKITVDFSWVIAKNT